jgi:hypothetical protein
VEVSVADQEQGAAVVGQTGKSSKLYVLGALGCVGMLATCCLLAALGSWLEKHERRKACGPPALARAYAERMLQLAAEDEASIQRSSPADPIQLRQKDEASRDAYRELAARVQARAEGLEEGEVLEFLYGESVRSDQAVIERLNTMQAALGPEDTAAREWLTERIKDCVTTREDISNWVNAKRSELEQKYEQKRRGSAGTGPGSGRIDPGPQTSGARTPTGEGVRCGYFEVTVTGARLADSAGSEGMATRAGAGNKLLIVTARVRNVDNEARMFMAGSLWAGGAQYDAPEPVLAEGYLNVLDNLNPGTTWSGKIAWKVPATIARPVDWQPARSDTRIRVLD